MQKKLRHIILSLLFISWLKADGQLPLLDLLKVQPEKQAYSFVVIPAYYERISQKMNLSKVAEADSFSFRLWTGSMFGYSLLTFENTNSGWAAHAYNYYSDTSIEEAAINPGISTAEFLSLLQAFNLDNFISQHQIKDFQDNADDGTLYTLEIFKGKNYRVLQYHSPELYKDADNKKFTELVKLFDKYFYKYQK